jgi:hypothetical protein
MTKAQRSALLWIGLGLLLAWWLWRAGAPKAVVAAAANPLTPP